MKPSLGVTDTARIFKVTDNFDLDRSPHLRSQSCLIPQRRQERDASLAPSASGVKNSKVIGNRDNFGWFCTYF